MTFDRDGKVPIHYHAGGRNRLWGFPPPRHFPAPEQTVPAWRGSEIGLETFSHHRAELWINHHPQLLRIGFYAKDSFLKDIAHWGVVGRYGNYPGDNRTERSLATELPDAPEHPIWMQTYTSYNPGHAWEFLGACVDFLITDAFDRSGGAISFPTGSMAGSPFRVNVFGHRPGRFYDEKGVHLWMPVDLLTVDNRQIDWLAGYDNERLYLAFWNQSFEEEQVQVTLKPERTNISSGKVIKAWLQNQKVAEGFKLSGNQLQFSVPAKGILAFAITGAQLHQRLQAKIFDPEAVRLGPDSFCISDAPFGKVHAMLLSMGKGLTNAFVYTDTLPEDVISAKFRYRQGNDEWKEIKDEIFPYELSTWINEKAGNFECILEIENTNQQIQKSHIVRLKL
jgi:hypothetical protein